MEQRCTGQIGVWPINHRGVVYTCECGWQKRWYFEGIISAHPKDYFDHADWGGLNPWWMAQ